MSEVWRQARPVQYNTEGVPIIFEVSSLKASRFRYGEDVVLERHDRKVIDLPTSDGVKQVSISKEHRKLFPELY
jgi:hypothetical protein